MNQVADISKLAVERQPKRWYGYLGRARHRPHERRSRGTTRLRGQAQDHRPGDRAEQFQQLRAAYSWALARIEHEQSADSDQAPSEADPAPPPENFHEPFDDTARSSAQTAYADASAAYAKVLEVSCRMPRHGSFPITCARRLTAS